MFCTSFSPTRAWHIKGCPLRHPNFEIGFEVRAAPNEPLMAMAIPKAGRSCWIEESHVNGTFESASSTASFGDFHRENKPMDFFPTCQVRVVRFYVSCRFSSPPRRTSTTMITPECSLPDLNHDHQRPVFAAGPQLLCQKLCQIECQKICQIECQKICQIECQKICQIECQKIWQTECQKIWQTECQKIWQTECQKIWQTECQKICQIECQISEDMTDRMSEDMTDRMSEDMPDGMPDRYAR